MYTAQLAQIHAMGFNGLAQAMVAVIKAVREQGIVVDLGCGPGFFLQQLYQQGFTVYGADISPAMIDLAKTKLPENCCTVSSIFSYSLPHCDIVTAMGEILSYATISETYQQDLEALFNRVYTALSAEGLFIFDCLDQIAQLTYKNFVETEEWVVLINSQATTSDLLKREIISFYRHQKDYRKETETHWLRVLEPHYLLSLLKDIGFHVTLARNYADYSLPTGRQAYFCHKIS